MEFVFVGIAFIAFAMGYLSGRAEERDEQRIRRRLEALPKPWEGNR